MNGTLANGATIVAGGQFGNAVSLAGGASVNINNPIVDLGNNGNWTVSAWVKTTTPGGIHPHQGRRRGWANGNTIFYLGDGTAGGSGGIPSARPLGRRLLPGLHRPRRPSTTTPGTRSPTSTTAAPTRSTSTASPSRCRRATAASPTPTSARSSAWASRPTRSAGMGTVNYNGLLDSVSFTTRRRRGTGDRPRSGSSGWSPPTTTNATIASGAMSYVTTQTIASPTAAWRDQPRRLRGAIERHGTHMSPGTSRCGRFAGELGTATLTLAGTSTYSGMQINAGTLRRRSLLARSRS